jgi:hypothetical protein
MRTRFLRASVCVGTRTRVLVRARLALRTQNAKRIRLIVVCGLSGSTMFFDTIS